jgi:hypothetical protein
MTTDVSIDERADRALQSLTRRRPATPAAGREWAAPAPADWPGPKPLPSALPDVPALDPLLLPAALLLRQVTRLDIDAPERCLALFKFNFETGLAVGLAILAGRL